MAYNEIYATKERSGIKYISYGNVVSYGGKTIREKSVEIENIPATIVKFPSVRRVDKTGYTEEEEMQIAIPYDFVQSELGGRVSKDDIIEKDGKSYRVIGVTDLSTDPLWGIYVIDLRRVRNAS